MKQNHEWFNLHVWYLFFSIYVEVHIHKDLTNLQNDTKYKETEAFDPVSYLLIFLDIQKYQYMELQMKPQ